MDYLQNHCWCSDSNWGGNYDCRHIVTIPRNLREESYHDGPHIDWGNVTTTKEYFDEDFFNETVKLFKKISKENSEISDLEIPVKRDTYTKKIPILKPEVINWLNENVKDRKGDSPKGWACGSDEYLSDDSSISLSVFFHRKSDAMNFIKTFSVFKKPVSFLNYFKDDRRKLNMETLKLDKI